MESKDKMIGAILIIVGIFFIGLGVFVNMNNAKTGKTNEIYQEQPIVIPENNTDNPNNQVDIYGTDFGI